MALMSSFLRRLMKVAEYFKKLRLYDRFQKYLEVSIDVQA